MTGVGAYSFITAVYVFKGSFEDLEKPAPIIYQEAGDLIT